MANRSEYEDFLGNRRPAPPPRVNSHGQEPLEVAEEVDAEEEGEGRSGKFQQFGLKVIWPGRGKARRGQTILYGAICSDILFDQGEDEQGVIWFEYETRTAAYRCTIRGKELDRLHDQLSEGKRTTLRVQGRIEGVVIEQVKGEKK